jgi:hypothetical protein
VRRVLRAHTDSAKQPRTNDVCQTQHTHTAQQHPPKGEAGSKKREKQKEIVQPRYCVLGDVVPDTHGLHPPNELNKPHERAQEEAKLFTSIYFFWILS